MVNAIAVITSCTQRKSGRGEVAFEQIPEKQSVAMLAQQWRELIGAAKVRSPVHALYKGRSILDTVSTAAQLGGEWYVVSAGMGLVRSDHLIPSYECTVAAGSDLDSRLGSASVTARDWWNLLTADKPRPLARLITQTPTLLALPGTYLDMVHDDLEHISTSAARQLRIFTSRAGMQRLPEHLVSCVMPYDDRLESVLGYAGTRSDFAQRAMRHFVQVLRAGQLPLEEARAAVIVALEHLEVPARPVGKRMTDDEIREVLKAQWIKHSGKSTLLLRYLRDEAHISCEQKRFRRIWQCLVTEMQKRGGNA